MSAAIGLSLSFALTCIAIGEGDLTERERGQAAALVQLIQGRNNVVRMIITRERRRQSEETLSLFISLSLGFAVSGPGGTWRASESCVPCNKGERRGRER